MFEIGARNAYFKLSVYRVVQSQIKPTLDKLNADPDVDVKYFASEAIASIAGKYDVYEIVRIV